MPGIASAAHDHLMSRDSERLLKLLRRDDLAIGNAIQLFDYKGSSQNLEIFTTSPIRGWLPSDVRLRVQQRFIGAPNFAEAHLKNATDKFGKSRRKIALVEYPEPFSEVSDKLILDCALTNWHSAKATQETFKEVDGNRHNFFEFFEQGYWRTDNPNILCLHGIVITSDHYVLGLSRDRTGYFNGSISISFEEQLKPSDLGLRDEEEQLLYPEEVDCDSSAENWLRRSICEEVYPLVSLYAERPAEAWLKVQHRVRSFRIIAGVFEEKIGGFALIAVIQLAENLKTYVDTCRGMLKEPLSGFENEGSRGYFQLADLDDLLRNQFCSFRYFANESMILSVSATLGRDSDQVPDLRDRDGERIRWLHPTSLYRADLLSRLFPLRQ